MTVHCHQNHRATNQASLDTILLRLLYNKKVWQINFKGSKIGGFNLLATVEVFVR